MNKWGIPAALEQEVIARDRHCVYCGVEFKESSRTGDRKQNPTWEHFDNDNWDDQSIMPINVARCCTACNASKGAKPLLEWLASPYCKKKNISQASVAEVVKRFLRTAAR
ncbi:MAG: HNH endonuclease [Elusimicrobia bacterium]|nr:HNH endonuclease [Elusimicrobiota bacterium]